MEKERIELSSRFTSQHISNVVSSPIDLLLRFNLAGDGGFEQPITGSKPVALGHYANPLWHESEESNLLVTGFGGQPSPSEVTLLSLKTIFGKDL